MNILYLNHNVRGKGTYHRCFGFARELAGHGHTVTLVTNSPSARLLFSVNQSQRVTIVETPDVLSGTLRTGWDPVNIIRRILFLRTRPFDIVHAFDTRPTVILPALYYTRFFRHIPLFIDWADWWGKGGAITLRKNRMLNTFFAPVETFFEEYFRHFADHTTVISTALQTRAVALGIRPKTISLLYSGADTVDIRPGNKKRAREILFLPLTSPICIFPSFVHYDLPMVINSFITLLQRIPNALLLLIGDYPAAIFEHNKRYIVSGNIRIIPHVDKNELASYLAASDVALLPLADHIANRARFPTKLGDYLAAGIPFVTNDVGDAGMVVKAHDLGYVCKYNADSFAQSISWILTHPKQAQEKAKRARVFALREFTGRKQALQLIRLYKTGIKQAHSS